MVLKVQVNVKRTTKKVVASGSKAFTSTVNRVLYRHGLKGARRKPLLRLFFLRSVL